jgi:HPt (histidine-containing phosphotransfer) domain-containing protein
MTVSDDDVPVLDPGALERLRALASAVARPGEDILGHLSRLFIEDSGQRLSTLKEAWARGAADDAARAAHTIKGAAANVGAVRVVAAAVVVEAACQGAFDEGVLGRLSAELDAAWAALRAEFSTTG